MFHGSYIAFITGDGGKHCIGGASGSRIIDMKPCGTGTGTIMTPYSEYGYGGVVGWDDLGGISWFRSSYSGMW